MLETFYLYVQHGTGRTTLVGVGRRIISFVETRPPPAKYKMHVTVTAYEIGRAKIDWSCSSVQRGGGYIYICIIYFVYIIYIYIYIYNIICHIPVYVFGVKLIGWRVQARSSRLSSRVSDDVEHSGPRNPAIQEVFKYQQY